MIGAPGKASDTGEAFVFEGDPTLPTFGNLLLDIANPALQIGRAVRHRGSPAGGDDVLIGSPSDNTAGPGAGAVYLFDGTTGTQDEIFNNPHPALPTGFGSAVAAVGQNVLIGAPQDSTAGPGAGAAFLFNGNTGLLLTSFAQPDGAGGGFGTSVAGTGTTALIGAPDANLGQANAGAAYLFDAAPSSPTFGTAIAGVGQPTPQAAGCFGESVAFSDQAVVVGAAAALGRKPPLSAPKRHTSINREIPLSVSSQVTFANSSNDSIILSGAFTDPGLLPITASIDWGDGSPQTLVNLPFGSYAFAVPHRYADDSAARYAIGVTLADDFGGTSVAERRSSRSAIPATIFAPSRAWCFRRPASTRTTRSL